MQRPTLFTAVDTLYSGRYFLLRSILCTEADTFCAEADTFCGGQCFLLRLTLCTEADPFCCGRYFVQRTILCVEDDAFCCAEADTLRAKIDASC